ncbi:hypothetical protein [Pseudomonas sp. M30-35]|uniref:hypothetical protein n=1 Tax=Pseudomonas sp. M30-35 TaxID=1981174 RepID=UPI000B3C319B|nr:hypothetical protein [Pseudomonas sp. M30-35]ARU88704.1 hypothetical protein B9K09_12345 [Pseudomonas sp. M30-35]
MSPLVITLLIVGGIGILMMIAYINHAVENNKLEKARLKAELNDRIRRCAEVSESMPGQLMSPELKLMLTLVQAHYSERLLAKDKSNNALKESLNGLNQLMTQGESIPVKNPPVKILTEQQAKQIRYILENLHGQISRAGQDGVLPAAEAKQWLQRIPTLLTQLHIEYFSNLGQRAMQQNQPGQARLAFERGVQYLRKQNDSARYSAQLKAFQEQLEVANSLVLNNTPAPTDTDSELTQGLDSIGSDEDWKKKNIYD